MFQYAQNYITYITKWTIVSIAKIGTASVAGGINTGSGDDPA
jgi:hypothetical protein